MCAGRTWTPRPPRREKADELRGRRAHAVRVHARAGDLDLRFTPAPTGQEGVAGTAGAAPAMKPRLPCPANTANCWCAPRRRRPRRQAPGRDQDLSWTPGQRAREPPRRALGAGQGLRPSAVPGARPAQPDGGAGVFQRRHRRGNHAGRDASGGRAGGVLQRAVRALPGLGAAGAGAPGRARRGAGGTALSARIPQRPARAGGGRHRKARDGGCLLAQAPTGIGKTLGTLFPLLKAAPEAGLDKLFFLAARGRAARWRCRRWTR